MGMSVACVMRIGVMGFSLVECRRFCARVGQAGIPHQPADHHDNGDQAKPNLNRRCRHLAGNLGRLGDQAVRQLHAAVLVIPAGRWVSRSMGRAGTHPSGSRIPQPETKDDRGHPNQQHSQPTSLDHHATPETFRRQATIYTPTMLNLTGTHGFYEIPRRSFADSLVNDVSRETSFIGGALCQPGKDVSLRHNKSGRFCSHHSGSLARLPAGSSVPASRRLMLSRCLRMTAAASTTATPTLMLQPSTG